MVKLTKRVIDSLTTTSDRPAYLWDDGLAGFGVKALPTGAKKYIVKYRVGAGGRTATQRWLTLGAHGQLTCDQARQMAQQALAAVARGEDPQGVNFMQRTAPTLKDVWERFESTHLVSRKPQTISEYRSQWRDIIEPALGRSRIEEISRSDVDRLHKSLGNTPYRANRAIALLSRLMTLAEAWELRAQGTNPCRFVERYKEKARTRYLSFDELKQLGEALHKLEATGQIQPGAVNAIKMLLLTGARRDEILTAQWAWVDWDRRLIRLPDSKTGSKDIFLSDEAVRVLKDQQRLSGAIDGHYIFPGRSAGKRMVNLRKPWTRVCEAAEISGVRIHDLRHTAASIAVGEGSTLSVIGRLLGHTQAQTTMRYAHVDIDPALVAANKIGSVVAGLINNDKQTAENEV